jgi:hypothetical protein
LKKQKEERKDKNRRLFFAIAVIVIAGCLVAWLVLAKEKRETQIALLEKIYNEFGNFQYIPDEFPFNWQGPYREKFEELCGEELDLEITLETEYCQSPSETLKKGGGDCEDFAILFVSAAKSLGFSARVVAGSIQGPKDPKPINHTWTEIYYKGKWRIIDPDLVVEKKGIPFREFIDHPEKFPMVKIDCRFDDVNFEGITPIEKLEEEKERCKKEAFDFLIYVFRNEKGREPFEKEINEIKEAAEDLHNQQWAVCLNGIPEDPRILIQPDNPEVKAWIEEIKSGKG